MINRSPWGSRVNTPEIGNRALNSENLENTEAAICTRILRKNQEQRKRLLVKKGKLYTFYSKEGLQKDLTEQTLKFKDLKRTNQINLTGIRTYHSAIR